MPNILSTFPTATVQSLDASLVVPAEPITDGLAITPCLDLSEATPKLAGGFTITHTPSGRMVTGGQACIECAREVGQRLAALPIAWPELDTSSAETLKAGCGEHFADLIAALRLFGKCAQQMCFHDEEGACDACGMERQHAPYCINVVGPMVAAANASVEANRATRPYAEMGRSGGADLAEIRCVDDVHVGCDHDPDRSPTTSASNPGGAQPHDGISPPQHSSYRAGQERSDLVLGPNSEPIVDLATSDLRPCADDGGPRFREPTDEEFAAAGREWDALNERERNQSTGDSGSNPAGGGS